MKNGLKKLVPRFVIKCYERQLFKETHINRALRIFGRETNYVEIGVRDGACIRQIKASQKYAIDPAPVAPKDIERNGVHLFEMSSDAFFGDVADDLFRRKPVDVALVDGLHEFRQALRDVLNLERVMASGGFIFVHDCNPPSGRHAEDPNGPWNGDVWKVAYYLTHHRKDLEFFTLDCDWGLGVISGFAKIPEVPKSDVIESVASLDYEVLDQEREAILNLRSPLSSLPFFSKCRLTRR